MSNKARIHLIGIPLLILLSAGIPAIYFLRSNSNLKARAIAVEHELTKYGNTVAELRESNKRLEERIAGTLATITGLEETNRGLEDSIRGFIDGIGNLEGTTGELGKLIQDSLGIVRGIQDRSE
jgi:hypothetical protein